MSLWESTTLPRDVRSALGEAMDKEGEKEGKEEADLSKIGSRRGSLTTQHETTFTEGLYKLRMATAPAAGGASHGPLSH